MEKRLLSVAEASCFLGISESFLYKLAEAKAVPHVRIGRALRFDICQLESWVRRQAVEEADYLNGRRKGR